MTNQKVNKYYNIGKNMKMFEIAGRLMIGRLNRKQNNAASRKKGNKIKSSSL